MNDHRVIEVWRDCRAGYVYLLQMYSPKFLWIKGKWKTKTTFTSDWSTAQKWALHYGVKIERKTGDESI